VQLQIDKRYSSREESLHLKLTLELGDGVVNHGSGNDLINIHDTHLVKSLQARGDCAKLAARAILDYDSRNPLGLPWHIQHCNHSCSRCGYLQQWHHTIFSGKRFKTSPWDGAPAGVAIGHTASDDGDGNSPLLPSSTTASPPPQRQRWRWIATATLRVD
jgi:hypothetical protein